MPYKVVITGKTETDVHGVGLREFISKVANSEKVKVDGNIRNIKNSNRVEILCKTKDDIVKLVDVIKQTIKDNPIIDSDEINFGEPKEVKDETIEIVDDKFEVIREDELTEMVWALQTAGKAVLSQEKIRSQNVIRGVLVELENLKNKLNEIDEKKELKGSDLYTIRFNVLSIEEFLREPPNMKNLGIDSKKLCSRFHIIYHISKVIEKMADSGENKDALFGPIDQLKKTTDEIDLMLKPLKDEN